MRWVGRHQRPPEGRRAEVSDTALYIQVYPSTLINASRMFKIATSIHRAGYFKETHLLGVGAEGLPEIEQLTPGVTVVRLRGSGRRGHLGRLLRAAFWQPRAYLRYRRAPLRVVAAHIVWVLPLCWLLCRRTGALLVYNAHELETETATMRGVKQRVARLIETRLVTRCSAVSVVNNSIADWYKATYSIPRPLVVGNIPVVNDEKVDLRQRLGVRWDEMLYIHTGNLVEWRNIPLILAAFSRATPHVVFLGDGHLRGAVLEAARAHPNIHWLEPVNPAFVVAHVREADVGLCLIESQLDLSYRLSSPNKLLESLAAGTPPLCSDLVEGRRLLGPLAHQWMLSDPAAELDAAIARVGKDDVRDFRSKWQGLTSWDEEVAPLVAAYGELLSVPKAGGK